MVRGRLHHLSFRNKLEVRPAHVARGREVAERQGAQQGHKQCGVDPAIALLHYRRPSTPDPSTVSAWRSCNSWRSLRQPKRLGGVANGQHEPIVGRPGQRRASLLSRIQPAAKEPGRHQAEAGEQDHALEGHGDERGQRIPRPAAHIDGPVHRRRPELEPQGQPGSGHAAEQARRRQPGTPPAERLFQAVYGIGGVEIDDLPAPLPHGSNRLQQLLAFGETGQDDRRGRGASRMRRCIAVNPRLTPCCGMVALGCGMVWRPCHIGGGGFGAVVGIRRQDALDLGHRNDRQNAAEDQETREEQAETAEEGGHLDQRRRVAGPAGREEIALQRRHDDDEPLHPHAHVHQDGNREHQQQAPPDGLEPEQLGEHDVAGHHDGKGPPQRAEGAIREGEGLVIIALVKRREKLDGVGQPHQAACGQHQLGHGFDMARGQVVLQVQNLADHEHQGQDHGHAGEDGPCHEVGRKDGGMPAGQQGGGEVGTHHGVDGDDQRRRQPGQQQVHDLVAAPGPVRPVPAQTEQADEAPVPPRPDAVAERGEVGDQTHVPEDQGDQEVGADGEEIPDQRRAEIDPQRPAPVGVRNDPVKQPRPAHVDDGKDAGAHHRNESHRLRGSVDRGPPFLAEQKEDGRDQGPGVTDADPEDEVGDVKGPADRSVEAPRADAHDELVGDGDDAEQQDAAGRQEGQPPPAAGPPLQGSANVRGDLRGGLVPADEGKPRWDGDASHAFRSPLPRDDSGPV